MTIFMDNGSLPYKILFVINKSYLTSTNVDISVGFVNVVIGT